MAATSGRLVLLPNSEGMKRFTPVVRIYRELGLYLASIAASTKRYWSLNAGALTVEMTTSIPGN